MAHYAKVSNGVVINVIVAEADFFDTFVDDSPGEWIQTSYNKNFRKNYAAAGHTYDKVRDAFIPPKPFNSWILNEGTCVWDAPVAHPEDGKAYTWNEDTQAWDEVTE